MYPLIALLTDFGTQDWFTAEMKAVIHGIAPQSTVIDISHAVLPGDIPSAAFILNACYKSFPAKSIFCIAVDATADICPAIIVHCDNYFFVASDNGILSWITGGKQFQVWHIKNKVFFHSSRPTTFRGRDVLGPVAAHLSRGIAPERFGSSASAIQTIRIPTPVQKSAQIIEGEIIYIDHFGNAITTIQPIHMQKIDSPSSVRIVQSNNIIPLKSNYYEVESLKGLAYTGSAGFIEIGINKGNAAQFFDLSVGDKVELF